MDVAAAFKSQGITDGAPVTTKRTFGVDLAAQREKTAGCVLAWDGTGVSVEFLGLGLDDPDIVRRAADADVTAIDAPFGWPRPFADALRAYAAGDTGRNRVPPTATVAPSGTGPRTSSCRSA